MPFAVSFGVLFITIQYAVFRKSFTTFYVSLYIYIYIGTRYRPVLNTRPWLFAVVCYCGVTFPGMQRSF